MFLLPSPGNCDRPAFAPVTSTIVSIDGFPSYPSRRNNRLAIRPAPNASSETPMKYLPSRFKSDTLGAILSAAARQCRSVSFTKYIQLG
jgi:hypothetical protein